MPAQDWPQAERPTRTRTINVTVDLRPALAVEAARRGLEAAQNEWAQAHLTDAESEDARQRVIAAEAGLAAALAAAAGACVQETDGAAPGGPLVAGEAADTGQAAE
jgi:hypothetical protein